MIHFAFELIWPVQKLVLLQLDHFVSMSSQDCEGTYLGFINLLR